MTIQFKHIFRSALFCSALGLASCDKYRKSALARHLRW